MSKISMVMESIWLVLAAFCLFLGIYSTVKVGLLNQSYMFFILAVVAFLMYSLRRYKRKQFSSNQNS